MASQETFEDSSWLWSTTATVIITVSSLGFAWYKYQTWNHSYWTARGIPQARPIPILGTGYVGFKQSLAALQMESLRKYGKIYG